MLALRLVLLTRQVSVVYCAIALVLYGMFVSSVIFDVPLNRFGRWCRDKCCAYQLRAVTFVVGV